MKTVPVTAGNIWEGDPAFPTNPKKYRAGKCKRKYAGHPDRCDERCKNMHGAYFLGILRKNARSFRKYYEKYA